MDNETYAYKSAYKLGDNYIIFIEEIILNILDEKNPILILKRNDYKISGKLNLLNAKNKFPNIIS